MRFALIPIAEPAVVEADIQQLVRSYITSTDISASVNMLRVTVGAIEVTKVGTSHALAIAPFAVGPSSAPQIATTVGAATLLLAKRDSGWKVVHEHFSYSAARRI